MKNITVSVDEETYRLSRIKAAERGTSVSALVRSYLTALVQGNTDESQKVETESQRRRRLITEVLEAIHARGGGLRMADNLPRDDLYDRDALR